MTAAISHTAAIQMLLVQCALLVAMMLLMRQNRALRRELAARYYDLHAADAALAEERKALAWASDHVRLADERERRSDAAINGLLLQIDVGARQLAHAEEAVERGTAHAAALAIELAESRHETAAAYARIEEMTPTRGAHGQFAKKSAPPIVSDAT